MTSDPFEHKGTNRKCGIQTEDMITQSPAVMPHEPMLFRDGAMTPNSLDL